MQVTLAEASQVGAAVKAARKAQRVRQDDAAGAIGVSENFLGKVERGSTSVHWGKLFEVLHGLGIRVVLDLPDEAESWLARGETRQTRGTP
ncbi:MAG: helix-turn-helix domain-containing protein [Rhodocyclaceae bacterium]|nr:helix-turn-helix domain-containing protein [Rhodocyclaceae bacterium]